MVGRGDRGGAIEAGVRVKQLRGGVGGNGARAGGHVAGVEPRRQPLPALRRYERRRPETTLLHQFVERLYLAGIANMLTTVVGVMDHRLGLVLHDRDVGRRDQKSSITAHYRNPDQVVT